MKLDAENLITLLENQLKESVQATDIYKLRLQKTINGLKSGIYQEHEDELINDLQSLGFGDLGRQIKRSKYV